MPRPAPGPLPGQQHLGSVALAPDPCSSPYPGRLWLGWVEGVSLLLAGSPWARPSRRGWGLGQPFKVMHWARAGAGGGSRV